MRFIYPREKNKVTTEEILWQAIKDIENGNVLLFSEDPMNGWLKGKSKTLNKMNVSYQSAKYNDGNDNKPISRPTIDSYPEIVSYIKNKKNGLQSDSLEEKYKKTIEHNKYLIQKNKELEELNRNLAFENYKLKENLNK